MLNPAPRGLTLLDSHEDRLQRLEDGRTEIIGRLEAGSQKMDSLGEKIEQTRTALDDQTDAIGVKIQTAAENLSKEFRNCLAPIADKIDDHSQTLKELTSERQARTLQAERALAVRQAAELAKDHKVTRWENLKKFFIPMLAAVVGVIVKSLLDLLKG